MKEIPEDQPFLDQVREFRLLSGRTALRMWQLAVGVVAVEEEQADGNKKPTFGRFFLYWDSRWELSCPSVSEEFCLQGEEVENFTDAGIGVMTWSGIRNLPDLSDFAKQHLKPVAPWHAEPVVVNMPNLQPDMA